MNWKVITSLLAAGAVGSLAACGSTSTSTSPSSSGGSGSTTVGAPLIEEGTTGVTFSNDFNPYDANSMASGMNMRSLVYEPLYEMDALDPNQNNPWLATGYSFSNGGKTLAVTIRSGVKFNNGTAMGPADVVATFKAMENAKADTSGVPAQSTDPTASGQTVTLSFTNPAYTALWEILGSTYIMPAATANEIASSPTTQISNTEAIGTGPFVPTTYTSSLVTFTPNKYYWKGTPPESKVEIPSISSNTNPISLLKTGQLDWAGNDIPNVYPDYVDLNPQTNHAWFASGNTVVLWFNQNSGNGGATGISDPKVRMAVSYGIDRNALALLGESGYEQPASSSSGLVMPNEQADVPSSLQGDLSTSGNVPDAATATADKLPTGDDVYDILKGDGYTPPTSSSYSSGKYTSGGNCTSNNPANCWEKGGQIIQFSVYDPVAFTDYWEDAQLISQSLQSLGMDVTTKAAQGYSDWNTTLTTNPSGWQTALHWGNGGNIPYVQLSDWLDASQTANSAAYTGYKNDPTSTQAVQDLQAYGATDPTNQSAIAAAVAPLDQIMSTDVPYVPVLYGADWNVYSSAKYTGWPDASNPYMDPSPDDPELPYILMQLKPVPGAS